MNMLVKIAELYNDTYAETLEQLKKDYSMMSYPLRKFLEKGGDYDNPF
jgi:hypothetical protein